MNNTLMALLSAWRKGPLFAPEGEGSGGAGGGSGTTSGEGQGNGNDGAQAGGPGAGGTTAGTEGTGGNGDGAGERGGNALPDAYTFEFPGGHQLSDAHRAAYNDMFRELGLTQEQVDKMITVEDQIAADFAREAEESAAAQAAEWMEAAQGDKELGKDWDLTQQRAEAGIKAVLEGADQQEIEDFIQLMDSTGLGNHPTLLKAFSRLGQLTTNDKFENGDTSADTVPTERNWYGATTPETKRG